MKSLALGLVLWGSLLLAQVPQSRHVWIVTEENHSYETVIGNSGMPYFNSLASQYGLATQYYSEQHNSISALMWLVAGQPITGNNSTTTCYTVDNIARHLIASGITWRSYQEDLPYAGFTGISNLYYVRRHNPIIDFTDTCAANQANNSVPFTQLAADIANHTTPNYAYVTPNLMNDAHNGPLSTADYWLSQNIPTILALPEFQPGGDGLLFIVWDEADLTTKAAARDDRCSANISTGCGGRLATLVIGPQVKPGYQSRVRYDHANLLRTVCDALEFSSCPGAGAVATPMADFFNDVRIATPFPDANVASPVLIQATASSSSQVLATQIYVDDVLRYRTSGGTVNTKLPMTAGQHHVVVQSWDAAGGIHKRGIDVNVKSEAVVVMGPAPYSIVGSPVPVSAKGGGKNAISKMQLYVDGNPQYLTSGNTLNTTVNLSGGNHTISVQATDTAGNLTANKFQVTSASPAVHILSPAANSSFYAPMQISATTVDPTPVTSVQIYVDNVLAYQVSGTGVQASLPISSGIHNVVVQAWNNAGASYKASVSVKVVPVPITISTPAANATVSSPVTIAASAPANSPVQTMQIYVDGVRLYQKSGQSLNHVFTLASGLRYVVAKGWDQYGNSWSNGEYINVQ